MAGLGLSSTTIIPLFTGMFLGISYGAGITIRVMQEKKIPRRELFLLGLFLCACHGVIEDTLIFVVLGGNGWVLFGARLLLAVTITVLLARLWKQREEPAADLEPPPSA
jgi:Fe2+ transport system protein B